MINRIDKKERQEMNNRALKITWISFIWLDLELSKTSRIEILRNLAKKGHDVELIAVRSRNYPILNNLNFKVTAIPLRQYPVITPLIFGIIILLYLPIYIIQKKPDYIISDPITLNIGFLWKPFLRNFIKFNLIMDIRTTLVYPTVFKEFNYNLSMILAKTVFDGITIITKGMRDEISQKYHIDSDTIGIWSDGAALDVFSPIKNMKYKSLLREKNGLTNSFIVMYHGDITVQRGILECVKAIAISRKKYPEITLFLLGSGNALPEIKKLIDKENLESNVILHGPVPYEEVPRFIAMSDVGIVPLPNYDIWKNQLPLKLLEYLSMQKPVIATDIFAHRNVVGNDAAVHFIDSSDSTIIASAIIDLYCDRFNIEQRGISGRKLVEENYNWRKSAMDFESYLIKIGNRE